MFIFKNKYLNSRKLKSLGIKCGENCEVHETVLILDFKKLILGSNIRIDPFCNFVNSQLICIEEKTHISSYVQIYATKKVTIGKSCGIGSGVKIFTSNDNFTLNKQTGPFADKKKKKLFKEENLKIKDYAQIASNSLVIPGAKIQEGSVAGAYSFINKPLNKWTIYSSLKSLNPVLKRKSK